MTKLLSALLARRLPAPLRILLEGAVDAEQRNFLFWWLVVTLALTLVLAALLGIVLAPVTAIIALLAVGIWTLAGNRRRSTPRS